MVALGVLARLMYRLSRHRFLGLPLDLVTASLAGGAFVYGVSSLLVTRRQVLAPVALAGLVLWAALVLLLRRRRFVLFTVDSEFRPPPHRKLEPFCRVPLRASGAFAVNQRTRYFVEAPGFIEATEFGERILMAQARRVSILGLLRSPEDEWGWWYIFLRPEDVRSLQAGRLYFGWRSRPALRLADAHGTVLSYLSFSDVSTRDRVAGDLLASGAGTSR
jgi:hypothetical protein